MEGVLDKCLKRIASRIRIGGLVLAFIPVRQTKRASSHVHDSTSDHCQNIALELSLRILIISSRQDGKRTSQVPPYPMRNPSGR